MFKEEETQYCPMCEEWAKKYKPIIDRLLHQFETYDKLKSLDVVAFTKQTFEQLDELKAENEAYRTSIVANLDKKISKRYEELLDENDLLKQTLKDIKRLVKKDYCSEIESCEFCAEIGDCINRKILQKCEVLND